MTKFTSRWLAPAFTMLSGKQPLCKSLGSNSSTFQNLCLAMTQPGGLPFLQTPPFPRQTHLEQFYGWGWFEQCPQTSCSPAWWPGPETQRHAHSTLKLQGELRKGFGDVVALFPPQTTHCMLPLLEMACIQGSIRQVKFQLSSSTSQMKGLTTVLRGYSTQWQCHKRGHW